MVGLLGTSNQMPIEGIDRVMMAFKCVLERAGRFLDSDVEQSTETDTDPRNRGLNKVLGSLPDAKLWFSMSQVYVDYK